MSQHAKKWEDPRSRRGNVEELRSVVFSQSLTQHFLILRTHSPQLFNMFLSPLFSDLFILLLIIFSVDNTYICSMLKYNIFISQNLYPKLCGSECKRIDEVEM